MRKTLLIITALMLAYFLNGCNVQRIRAVTDYTGKELQITDSPFIIKSYERDVSNPDIFYLTCYGHLIVSVEFQQAFSREMSILMDKYEYIGYHVISYNTASGYRAWLYKIHFHKTEEDFDKWDRRYKH